MPASTMTKVLAGVFLTYKTRVNRTPVFPTRNLPGSNNTRMARLFRGGMIAPAYSAIVSDLLCDNAHRIEGGHLCPRNTVARGILHHTFQFSGAEFKN